MTANVKDVSMILVITDRKQSMTAAKDIAKNSPKSDASPQHKTWQQTKSEKTRTTILDATIDCFYEIGYGKTTTEKVARRARVSRGAMLHHFPSRVDLVTAAVVHLNQKRLLQFEQQELKINEGAQHTRISEGIDAYWKQLDSPLFIVHHELKIAARTDRELHDILKVSGPELERQWEQVSRSVFPDLALSDAFKTANQLTLFLLEGMAVRGLTEGEVPDRMLPWLKSQLEQMFADVSGVDRVTALSEKQP